MVLTTEPNQGLELTLNDKKISSENVSIHNRDECPKDPPDGGFRAYSVMVGSFLTNGLLFGVINSYGVIYEEVGVKNLESKAALVGAMAMGTTFLLSPVSGVLTGLMGLRLTAVLGGAIATIGLIISAFVTANIDALCFSYGFLYGLGASLAYTPSLAILGHYFKKHLGIVNGIVTVGSSVFTVVMPTVMKIILKNYGLVWLFRFLALLTFGIALCGLLFKPIPLVVLENPSQKKGALKLLIKVVTDVQIWKNKKYRFWALSMPVALFGYFVPYVHLLKYVKYNFADLSETQVNVPLQCIALTSGIGRILFGFLADKQGIDRILLQQISFYVIGLLTIILPFVHQFIVLILVTLGMGLFDGAFIALIGPIAFELCGNAHAAQAIGSMLGIAAIPLCIGPPVAGYIYNIKNSYTLPFVLAGISPLVGASLMFSVRFHKSVRRSETERRNGYIGVAKEQIELNEHALL